HILKGGIKMKNIYLIRHCTAAGQHPDSPLTRDGLRQAVQLKDFFISQNIDCDRIISSPYLRAIDSIRPYAEQIGLPIDVDERLKERILSDRPIDDWLDVLEQSFMTIIFVYLVANQRMMRLHVRKMFLQASM